MVSPAIKTIPLYEEQQNQIKCILNGITIAHEPTTKSLMKKLKLPKLEKITNNS